jgi:hypothetical protein
VYLSMGAAGPPRPTYVPQITSPQICGLKKFVISEKLLQMWKLSHLRFADPLHFVISAFTVCGPSYFLGLKTSYKIGLNAQFKICSK